MHNSRGLARVPLALYAVAAAVGRPGAAGLGDQFDVNARVSVDGLGGQCFEVSAVVNACSGMLQAMWHSRSYLVHARLSAWTEVSPSAIIWRASDSVRPCTSGTG